MQVALGGVEHQPGKRPNEQQGQENEIAGECARSRPQRPQTWPRRPSATAPDGRRRSQSFYFPGCHGVSGFSQEGW